MRSFVEFKSRVIRMHFDLVGSTNIVHFRIRIGREHVKVTESSRPWSTARSEAIILAQVELLRALCHDAETDVVDHLMEL